MRVELSAIKAAIEVAMSHDIELDESVPEELVETIAELHSRIDRLEREEKTETGGVEVRSLDDIERDLLGTGPEAPADGEPEGTDDLSLGAH